MKRFKGQGVMGSNQKPRNKKLDFRIPEPRTLEPLSKRRERWQETTIF
jgi:hypothetical protein